MPGRELKILDFSIVDHLPVGVFITDSDLRIRFWNKKLELWTGFMKDEVLGTILTDIYPHLKAASYLNRIMDVARGSPSVLFSSQLHPYFIPSTLRDGSYRIQSTTLTRNYDETLGTLLVFTIQDNTDTHRHLQKIKSLRRKAVEEIKVREKVQIELKESQEMLASINRNITEGIFRLVPNKGITYANQALVSMLGYEKREDLKGSHPLVHHIISENKHEILERIYVEHRLQEEILVQTVQGKSFWGQLSTALTLSNEGSVESIDCLISDITMKKKQLQKVQESEEHHRNIFQNSMMGMYRVRMRDGKILNINKKGLEIFGFDSLEQSQNHIIYKDADEWKRLRRTLIKEGSLDEIEVRLRRKNGTLFWGSASARIYPKEGYFEGIVIDIEERKKAQHLQSALYRIAERSSRLQEMNEFYTDLYRILNELMDARNLFVAEYNSEKKLVSYPFIIDEYEPKQPPHVLERSFAEQVMQSDRPILLNKAQFDELKNQKELIYSAKTPQAWLAVPLKTIYEPLGVIGVVSYEPGFSFTERDKEVLVFVSQHISTALERKRYEDSLLKAKEEAEAASRTKSQFLANMSHELRTPLNSIIGFTRRVQKRNQDVLDSQTEKALDTVQRNASNLLKLINDVLDISKVEAGKLDYNISIVQVNELVQTLVEELEPLATQKGLSINFQPMVNEFARVDPLRLRQVVTNILGNAIKFTDYGGITITINREKSELGLMLCIRVEDTGVGMNETEIPVIFELFEQLNYKDTTKRGGTGLGLAISKKMISDMNGDIRVTSKLGEGSTFDILLPAYQRKKIMA